MLGQCPRLSSTAETPTHLDPPGRPKRCPPRCTLTLPGPCGSLQTAAQSIPSPSTSDVFRSFRGTAKILHPPHHVLWLRS